jgi:hypothetical protein
MTNEEYIKELKELYAQAKKADQNSVAHELLQEIRDLEDDPCGVEDFRKQADDKE